MKKLPKFDEETISARVKLSEMVVDDEYQGRVNTTLIEKIAAAWDDSNAGVIILNLRDGGEYAVLDGQHRVLAGTKAGVESLNALVFIGKTRKEEAALFVALNTKHTVLPFDKFRANLLAGKTEEVAIKNIVEGIGLKIDNSVYSADGVRCIQSLRSLYNNYGAGHLINVLTILRESFKGYPDRKKAWSDAAVIGMSQMLARYPEVQVDRLVEKIKAFSPITILGIAQGRIDPGQGLWMGWGKAITGMYNAGMRTANPNFLPMDRWDKNIFSPVGKAIMSNNAKKSPLIVKKMGATKGIKFNPETARKASQRSHELRLAAKTTATKVSPKRIK